MSSFSFRDLNLGGVDAESSYAGLPPGRYICEVSEAKLAPCANNGMQVVVSFVEVGGLGNVRDYINIVNKNEDAQRIGRGRLKSLLINGGHPNPDNPGDIASLKGLHVGVNVEIGDDYTDQKTGQLRKGSSKVRRNGGYFDPAELGMPNTSRPAGNAGSLNDEIPF